VNDTLFFQNTAFESSQAKTVFLKMAKEKGKI
jgi:hypothetical protein